MEIILYKLIITFKVIEGHIHYLTDFDKKKIMNTHIMKHKYFRKGHIRPLLYHGYLGCEIFKLSDLLTLLQP